MKAFVFSIGEKTTDLCVELMQEMGFDIILLQDKESLWHKLKKFYTEALETEDNEFVRIDADIIPNKRVLDLIKVNDGCMWHSAVGFDWYKQDRGSISIHHMKRDAVEICLENIESARDKIRPESHLWRIQEFHWPRVCHNVNINCGLHGYGQKEHRERIKALKYARGQEYQWDLIDKIEALS